MTPRAKGDLKEMAPGCLWMIIAGLLLIGIANAIESKWPMACWSGVGNCEGTKP